MLSGSVLVEIDVVLVYTASECVLACDDWAGGDICESELDAGELCLLFAQVAVATSHPLPFPTAVAFYSFH